MHKGILRPEVSNPAVSLSGSWFVSQSQEHLSSDVTSDFIQYNDQTKTNIWVLALWKHSVFERDLRF
jgi:hypothetical protein